MAQRREFVIPLVIGEGQGGRPGHGIACRIARPGQLVAQGFQFAARGRAIEAADLHIDRMHFAPADCRHDGIAGLLHPQPALDRVPVIARHLDRAGIAQEIGRMQHVDMQHMAFDPFAAIEQPAQIAGRARHRHAAGRFHRLHGAHLVGDGTDAADARGDVRRFAEIAAGQEAFEEARRLEDVELDMLDGALGDAHLQRAFAFDPGQCLDDDPALSHGARSRPGRPAHRH